MIKYWIMLREYNCIIQMYSCIIFQMADSQTFVKALMEWSSKIFFGGSNVIFVPNLYYFWPKKRFFLPFSRFFLHQKNLASFLVILVQVYFPSQGTQKSLNTGLPHHFGIVQSWSLRSENFRGLGSQENSGHCLECSTQMASKLQQFTIFEKFSENKKSP